MLKKEVWMEIRAQVEKGVYKKERHRALSRGECRSVGCGYLSGSQFSTAEKVFR